MSKIEEHVRAADQRPGYKVVNYREVALPVFKVQPLVTLQSISLIGPIEMFISRLLRDSFDASVEIASFLGLPEGVVSKQIGNMVYEGTVAPKINELNKFVLTQKGIQQFREESKSNIAKEVIPFYVDGITREVTPITSHSLYRNKDLESYGLVAIPPIPRHTPRGEELSINQMNSVLDIMGGDNRLDKKVIKVDALVDKNHLFYRPAIALAFKSDNGRSVSIGFIIEGILSNTHEKVFMSGDDARRSTIFSEIFDSGRRRQEIQRVSKEVELDLGFSEKIAKDPTAKSSRRSKLTLHGVQKSAAAIESSQVRTLSVYEHPGFLEQAITEAMIRLLIISPWIRGNVVDELFLSKLEDCLKRGVKTTIAYGIGRTDKEAREKDLTAIKLLSNLEEKYDNFELKRKGNTHAKVLIKDSEFFITTSFNWLSFRGDPALPFREEEGTCVTGKNVVDEYYERLMSRMTDTKKGNARDT